MNMTNITDKIINGKWMMERKSLISFYNTVENIASMRIGGIKGMIMGNPAFISMESEAEDKIEMEGDIAVIDIRGILSKNPSIEEQQFLGMCDVDEISLSLDEAAADPSIKYIILRLASPGGETTGIAELGRKIKAIDTTIKPVYAWTESQMCSAAAWLGVNARCVGMTETASIGSCGVYMLILDLSEKYKQEGINIQSISSGKWKMLGHDNVPLSDEEKQYLTEDVKKQHQKFIDVVKSNRPDIKDDALEGLSYEGLDAFNNGWVDFVGDSLQDFVNEIEETK